MSSGGSSSSQRRSTPAPCHLSRPCSYGLKKIVHSPPSARRTFAQNSLWLNWMSRSRGMSEKKCGPVVSRKNAKEGKPHQTTLIGFGSRYGWVMVARQRTSRIPAQLLPSRFAAYRTVRIDRLVWSLSWQSCGARPESGGTLEARSYSARKASRRSGGKSKGMDVGSEPRIRVVLGVERRGAAGSQSKRAVPELGRRLSDRGGERLARCAVVGDQ